MDPKYLPEELTMAQVDELHAKLLSLRDEIIGALHQTKDHSKPVQLDQARIGRLSRIDAIQQQQMAGAQRRRQQLRLAQIEAALERLEDEEYGWCTRCDEPIGYARLRARPESPLCMICLNEIDR